MKTLRLLLISLLITIVWGICFIDIESDKFSSLIGFGLTASTSIYINKQKDLSLGNKVLLFTFPVIYIILVSVALKDVGKILFSPLNFLFLMLVLGVFFFKKKFELIFILLFSILTIGYSYTFFPKFKNTKSTTTQFYEEISENLAYDLKEFTFYTITNNPIQLDEKKIKFILTWNKTCTPCKKAIKNLKDYFIENMGINYYLINIPFTKDDFQYSEIESIIHGKHDNIHLLNDKDMNLLNKLKLQSVPTFLILD